jgi:5-methylthioadenosine/S-adenosylhomocysteine deaminase
VASHPAFFLADHLTNMTRLARELGVKLHVHLLENIAQRGENAFETMEIAGSFDLGHDLLTAHTIHLTDAEIARLASGGATASHQPLSNMRLASGVMRLPDLKNAGIDLGLGLDGGTNDTPDMFNNMRAAVGLQRGKSLDPLGPPTVPEVLRMATLGGAELLDIDGQVGSLTPGKQADLFIMNTDTLNFAPTMNLVNQIVFNGQPDNVTWVFVAGRALKKSGKIVGVNIKALLDDAQVAADNIRPALVP